MKNRSDPKDLLDDVLAEAASSAFRDELLDGMLARVRRRERNRRWGRGFAGTAVMLGIGCLVWPWHAPESKKAELGTGGLAMVSSQPLESGMIIESVPGLVQVINSTPAALAPVTIHSTPGGFRELSDEQLLAMMGKTPAVLVRHGAEEAELLVADTGAGMIRPGVDSKRLFQ